MKKLKANIFGGGDAEVTKHIEKQHNKQFSKALDKKKGKGYTQYGTPLKKKKGESDWMYGERQSMERDKHIGWAD